MTSPATPANPVLVDGALAGMRAVLFDLDGVLTPTADVHMRAWSRLFNTYFAENGKAPYTEDDYFEFLDGRPRYDGVHDMLGARGIELPWGLPSDAPDAETVCGLGNRKNEEFNASLLEDGVVAYPGSVLFLDAVQAHAETHPGADPLSVAVVSSSKNAEAVLVASGLRDRFGVVVDGILAARLGLAGKPAPATYEYAAELLGFDVSVCVVVEDAVSGVAAGRAGRFGRVIGVDRGVGSQSLYDNGADLVVSDLAELVEL